MHAPCASQASAPARPLRACCVQGCCTAVQEHDPVRPCCNAMERKLYSARARPVRVRCVRLCCTLAVQEHALRATTLHCKATRRLFSHLTCTSHFTLHTCISSHLTSSYHISFLFISFHFIPCLFTSHLKKVLFIFFDYPSVLFVTTRLEDNTYLTSSPRHQTESSYIDAAIPPRKIRNHPTYAYIQTQPKQLEATATVREQKNIKTHGPQPPHTRGTFHRRLHPLYTEKHKVSCPNYLPKQSPCNIHAATTRRFATSRSKPASVDAHGNTTWQHRCSHPAAICNL